MRLSRFSFFIIVCVEPAPVTSTLRRASFSVHPLEQFSFYHLAFPWPLAATYTSSGTIVWKILQPTQPTAPTCVTYDFIRAGTRIPEMGPTHHSPNKKKKKTPYLCQTPNVKPYTWAAGHTRRARWIPSCRPKDQMSIPTAFK